MEFAEESRVLAARSLPASEPSGESARERAGASASEPAGNPAWRPVPEAREKMAWADILAGLCIANSGVTLPHGMGMAIGGMYPKVAHGEALAIVYPAFAEFTWESAITQFARLARILNSELSELSDRAAASQSPLEITKFLRVLGLNKNLKDIGMPKDEIEKLAAQCMVLPDYKGNPKVATENEMIELVQNSY